MRLKSGAIESSIGAIVSVAVFSGSYGSSSSLWRGKPKKTIMDTPAANRKMGSILESLSFDLFLSLFIMGIRGGENSYPSFSHLCIMLLVE
jgi:hypothetical protein